MTKGDYVGCGSYRDVYRWEDGTGEAKVIKYDIDPDYEGTNLMESQVYQKYGSIKPKINHDGADYTLRLARTYEVEPEDGRWLIQEFVDHKNIDEYTQGGVDDFEFCLDHNYYARYSYTRLTTECVFCTLESAIYRFYGIIDISGDNVKYNPHDSEFIVIDYSH